MIQMPYDLAALYFLLHIISKEIWLVQRIAFDVIAWKIYIDKFDLNLGVFIDPAQYLYLF